MIEKLNSGICTLGELINICLQPQNYETDYVNKSEHLIQVDKNTPSYKRRKSEEDVYSLIEAHLNEDISRKRAKTKFNQNEEYDNRNLIEQILSSTIDYQIKSNQIIINTKNSQKERVTIKVKVFHSKDEAQHNELDESTYIVSSHSNLIIIVEFAKLITFGQIKPDTEDTKNEINDYKRRILSSLSHELRTPLNCSIQLLEILLQNEDIEENQKKMFVEPAFNSNQLLLCMINDILDLAQIEKGEMRLQFNTFCVIDLLRECLSYFMIQAASKQVQIELNFDKSIPYIIRTDEMRLKQVVNNLLSNAIKFTSKGKISIYADNETSPSPDPNSHEVIRISISDTGCGIEPQNLKSIFEGLQYNEQVNFSTILSNDASSKKSPKMQSKFHHQKKLNTEGAGLGLTIANKIARGLGGNRKIEVQSQLGQGSSFSFFVVNRSTKSKGVEINNYKFLNKSYFQWKSFQSNTITKDITEYINHNNIDQYGEQSLKKLDGSYMPNKPSLTIKTNADDFFKNNISIQDINLLEERINRDSNLISPNKQAKIRFQHQALQYANNQKSYSNRLIEHNSNLNQSYNQEDSCDVRSDYNSSKNIPIPNIPISPFIIAQTQNNNGKVSSYFANSPTNRFRESICVNEPPSSHFENFPKNRSSFSNQQICIVKDEETEQLHNKVVQFLKQARLSKVLTQSNTRQLNFHQSDTTSSAIEICSPQLSSTNIHLQNIESTSSQKHIKKYKQSSFQQQTSSLRLINNPSGSSRRISIQSPSVKNDDYEKINDLKNDINQLQQKSSQKNIKTLLIERNQQDVCKCSHILIVDDNDFNLLALEYKLKSYYFIVEKANSGIKAISMIQEKFENSICCQKYGLIFMDIDMPTKNGYQTTKEIRQYYLQKNTTPTIISACTAFVQEQDEKIAKEAGMKYYITKPIKTDKIEEVLFKVFLQKQQIHKK